MKARHLLLIAAIIPTGMLTSCSIGDQRVARTSVASPSLGESYKFQATRYTTHSVTPDSKHHVSLVSRGNQLENSLHPWFEGTQERSSLHYHPGTLRYDSSVTNNGQYRHSHLGQYPHSHDVEPELSH